PDEGDPMRMALMRWSGWMICVGVLLATTADAEPFGGLSWEQRWDIADSLDQSSRQAVQTGDYQGALRLIDAALLAHPAHYRSWLNRWNLQLRRGLEQGLSHEELVASITADLRKVEAADPNADQAYVLSFADGRLFQLTGDSTHLERRTQRLTLHLAEQPDTLRAFDFHLSLAKWAVSDEQAREHFRVAQSMATTPGRRREWSQAALERGIAHPRFLDDDDLKAALTQWHSTLAFITDEGNRVREEANLVVWHGRVSTVRGDTAVVAHLVDAFAHLRRKLLSHEEQIVKRGWQAPVGPFAILDSRAEAMHGDLEMLRGDREAAEQHFRRAWQIIGPIVEQWDRSRDVLAGEHLRQLRQRLLPYVSQR
ncbi:MAG: hypothetical protein VX528_08905, partial [Candidatus Latescibacterota bacterium]|nr:hypothetical protein [Candidatus Latescibacterota bacterium]